MQREFSSVEQVIASSYEEEEQDELERVYNVIGYLRCNKVQAEDGSRCKRKNGCRSQHGIDSDDQANSERPRYSPWRRAHAQEREHGCNQATLKEVLRRWELVRGQHIYQHSGWAWRNSANSYGEACK